MQLNWMIYSSPFFYLFPFSRLRMEEERRERKKLVNKEGSRISAACQPIPIREECRRLLVTRWRESGSEKTREKDETKRCCTLLLVAVK